MAVYTHLDFAELEALIDHYPVGRLQSAKGIAEGVSNSNWLIETEIKDERQRYILTMYERRIALDDLPFFLGLLDFLSAQGCPVPRTIHDLDGNSFRMIGEKAVALIEFLPGSSPDLPSPSQAHSVGSALASIHRAAMQFDSARPQTLGPDAWETMLRDCGAQKLDTIEEGLSTIAFDEIDFIAANWPTGLAQAVVHCDLFPDNVLFTQTQVSGLIDFYFSATDFLAYDLAVTHAAWSFTTEGEYREEIGAQLLAGYEVVRPLPEVERLALPTLARGACLRFIASRAHDWLHRSDGAIVTLKDPMDFVRRLMFYRQADARLFGAAQSDMERK